jgi:glyoxylase-like metal-dependent hydrolase (beta-lactamase superfamily II)
MGVDDGWMEIGERVLVRRYAFYDQNIGLILGDGEVAVIDTRSTYGQAREIIAHVRQVTRDPITTVIDTHGHFDHAYGNRVFRPCTIWGQAGCIPFMERTGERRKAAIAADEPTLAPQLPEIEIDPPDRTFERETTIEVGGRPVELRFLGRGHTDHDAIVTIPGTSVVWAGDLLEQGNVPFFGDGYPLDWPATAAAVAHLVAVDGGVVVPGHGDHGGRAFADAQARSIAALADAATRVHRGDLGLDAAVATHPFPEHPPEDARPGFVRALAQLRDELGGSEP